MLQIPRASNPSGLFLRFTRRRARSSIALKRVLPSLKTYKQHHSSNHWLQGTAYQISIIRYCLFCVSGILLFHMKTCGNFTTMFQQTSTWMNEKRSLLSNFGFFFFSQGIREQGKEIINLAWAKGWSSQLDSTLGTPWN